MKRPPKQRFRLWVNGDTEFQQRWNDWTASQGVIAEDMLRKIIAKAMEHGKVSFVDADCGYHNSQSETEAQ